VRRQRDFRIRKLRRIYSRSEGKFAFNISYETHTKPTPRSLVVAEAFGLGIDETQKFKVLDAELKIGPQDIVYITGDSGSGKSVLLRAIRADLGEEAIDLTEVQVDPDKPLIETVGATVEQGLELLSKVGLNDAFLFLRTYSQLSDGQKYRYKIAKLIESGKQWWLMDEFAACLDRDTAKIIAFNLQKIARSQGRAAIVATTHSDLVEDLSPSVFVVKRFGEEIDIKYLTATANECSLIKEMRVEVGTREDWLKLAVFHYRGHNTSVARRFFRLMRGNELCGVIVYCYPSPSCFGRRLVLPKMTMTEVNAQISLISRLVVHPKYRTVGLGAKLIHDTLPLAGTQYVELIAVMPKYSPFAEKAGMQKIAVQKSVKSVAKISGLLVTLGFDLQFLGSKTYIKEVLEGLDPSKLAALREGFLHCKHPRFQQQFCNLGHQLYFKREEWATAVKTASLEKLGNVIKIIGVLLQMKVYLFWNQPNNPGK
jgi:ABC-type ATPase with predicted acetyltransferase domain